MLTCTVVLLALFASAQGRAVNISNTWVLPEEGFPVFYRYFRDRISWYEADAVCQFHHANLVTVDTTAQYDAVRAYLKELDISSAVWVGLIRSNPDGDFTWTDYRGLSGDGYWSSPPDTRAAPLCVAADPAADYRWEALACGGPTVASFICELPVPQWALGNEGCMVRELPALTVLYLPESAAVQLTADCGLAGVKRVQCTGNMKRENLLKDLSCVEEDESSTPRLLSTSASWPVVTDSNFNTTDQDSLTETTTEEDIITERETDVTKSKTSTITPSPYVPQVKQQTKVNEPSYLYSQKNVNIDVLHTNNQLSNDIPKLANNDNYLSIEQSQKLEDEKHMHYKMLHEELARRGNFETIFTQPTDHFVPPLVMAKAKISDDMTVLSLAEKHAQHIAEQHVAKHNFLDGHSSPMLDGGNNNTPKITTEGPKKIEIIDKPIVSPVQSIKTKEVVNKDKIKNTLPKKYNEKYDDPKNKNFKIDGKLYKLEKVLETVTPNIKAPAATTAEMLTIHKDTLADDLSIDLQIILKEPTTETYDKVSQSDKSKFEREVNFTSTEKLDTITLAQKNTVADESQTTNNGAFVYHNFSNINRLNETYVTQVETTEKTSTSIAAKPQTESVTMNHEVIKITLLSDNVHTRPTETVFEITTRVPEFKETVSVINEHDPAITLPTTEHDNLTEGKDVVTTTSNPTTYILEDNATTLHTKENIQPEIVSSTMLTKTEHSISTTTLPQEIKNKAIQYSTEQHNTTASPQHYTDIDKTSMLNITDVTEDLDNNSTESLEEIDDSDSPLLSAANQPLHRPNRSRRPQTQSRIIKKFNPFRMLG